MGTPEHEKQLEKLEREGRSMQQEVDRLGHDVDEARSDWRSKREDDSVPGAEPLSEDERESESESAPDE